MKNKTKLLIAPLLVVPFLTSCNHAKEYKVYLSEIKGVTITPGKATKGKDYVGTIKIDDEIKDIQLLPDTLDKVTSGNKELQPTDYTYTLKEDKLTADFKIPAANIVGDVSIQLSLAPNDPKEKIYGHTFTYVNNYYENKEKNSVRTMSGIRRNQSMNNLNSFSQQASVINQSSPLPHNNDSTKAIAKNYNNVSIDSSSIIKGSNNLYKSASALNVSQITKKSQNEIMDMNNSSSLNYSSCFGSPAFRKNMKNRAKSAVRPKSSAYRNSSFYSFNPRKVERIQCTDETNFTKSIFKKKNYLEGNENLSDEKELEEPAHRGNDGQCSNDCYVL